MDEALLEEEDKLHLWGKGDTDPSAFPDDGSSCSDDDDDEAPRRHRSAGRLKLQRSLLAAFVPEYGLVPVFYALGKHDYFKTANAAQLAFVIGSGAFQAYVAKELNKKDAWGAGGNGENLKGYVQTVFGLPVAQWRLPRTYYQFALQIPNYVHVQQTAVVCGAAWKIWQPCLQRECERRWAVVPVIGTSVGQLGLPGMLTGVLVTNSVVHAISAIASYATVTPDEQADAANMLFLGRFIATGGPLKDHTGGAGISRLVVALVGKIPAIWVKTSLFALTYDFMGTEQKISMIVAVALAWYAVAPAAVPTVTILLPAAFKEMTKENGERRMEKAIGDRCGGGFCFAVLASGLALLLVLALHFFGVFSCPSHDLSITHGCTVAVDISCNGTVRPI